MTSFIGYLSPVLQTPGFTKEQIISLSMVVIALLFTLLVQKEFIRAYGSEKIRIWFNAFDIFTWSLLVIFAFVIIMRVLGFIFN